MLPLNLQYVGLSAEYAFMHAVRMRIVHVELISLKFLNVLAQVARKLDKLST